MSFSFSFFFLFSFLWVSTAVPNKDWVENIVKEWNLALNNGTFEGLLDCFAEDGNFMYCSFENCVSTKKEIELRTSLLFFLVLHACMSQFETAEL